MLIADAHCDTLSGMLKNSEGLKKNNLQINLNKLKSAGPDEYLQFFAVFVSPSLSYEEGKKQTNEMIGIFDSVAEDKLISKIREKSDLIKPGIKGLLAVEGMYFNEDVIDSVVEFYRRGVRCMSLTWNPDNEYSGGILGNSGNGLTKTGKKAIEKAFELGVLVDVSHISDKGFYDIAEIAKGYKKPFAATHSNSRRLCHHMRNLDDSMLKVLAESGGFTGINVFSCFLDDDCNADIDDVISHIEYICALTGPKSVGFGTDFDGIDRNKSAIDGPEEISLVLERLLALNYNEVDVKNIASGNILNVLNKVLK